MKKSIKRTLAFLLCVALFATTIGTSAFAIGNKADEFYTWLSKARKEYQDHVIKTPRTWGDYSYNNALKYNYLTSFNQHQAEAIVDVARESVTVDQATYALLVVDQKLKEQEWRELAAREKAARDKAVLDTEMARADAWQAAVAGVPANEAYNQYLNNGEKAVKEAQNEIQDAKADYDAAAGVLDDTAEALQKERERLQKELAEELARLRNAKP